MPKAETALLGRAIIARGLFEFLDVRWRQLWSINRQRELAELACKLEWDLVVCVVDGGAGVRPYVEILIPLHDERDGVLHALARHLLAVDLKHAGTAATNAAHVVESECAEALARHI